MTRRLHLPYVVTAYGKATYAILDISIGEYVARCINDREAAYKACAALNHCYSDFDDDGKLIAVHGVPLSRPLRVTGGDHA